MKQEKPQVDNDFYGNPTGKNPFKPLCMNKLNIDYYNFLLQL